MTKTARLSLIAAICGAKLAYCVTPTRADTQEEISLAVSLDDRNTVQGNDLRDGEDLPALSSHLPFERAKAPRAEHEGDYILTAKERAQLRADMLAYKIWQDLSRPVNTFALVLRAA